MFKGWKQITFFSPRIRDPDHFFAHVGSETVKKYRIRNTDQSCDNQHQRLELNIVETGLCCLETLTLARR